MQSVNSNICNGRNDVGCGGKIIITKKPGRYFLFKEVFILLDDDLEIPRCNKCNTDWLDFDTEAALDVVLAREYEVHEGLILEARERDQART